MSSYDSRPAEASVPKSDPDARLVKLKIEAATPFTEIRVLDARFEPVALPANTGAVEVAVTPGLYEVGFRCGDDWESQHVIAEPGRRSISVRQKTRRRKAARTRPSTASAEPPRPAAATVVVSLEPPGGGDTGGLSVALISADGAQTIAPDLTPDAGSTWCFPVAPGFWRLRINEALARQPFEMAITVVPNYVARVRAPLTAADEGLRVDLDKLRFDLPRRGAPEAVSEERLAFEEAALAALGTGRSLFGERIDRLIDDLAEKKALNPMLGILAAHLCERGDDDHLSFRARLLDRLEEMTGGPSHHPDVAILRIAFEARHRGLTGAQTPILFPPILAASWRLLLDVARERPELIPPGSLCEHIADRLWSSSLWTAWTAPPLDATPVTAQPAEAKPWPAVRSVLAAAEPHPPPQQTAIKSDTIAELLAHPEVREWLREASGQEPAGGEGLAWDSEAMVTPAEVAVASAIFPVAQNEVRQSMFLRLADRFAGPSAARGLKDAGAIAEELGLPRATVDRAVGRLADKLGAVANNLKIKF